MKSEFHVLELMRVKTISSKIYMNIKICFEIVRFQGTNENI
jgi:hypothetical protein